MRADRYYIAEAVRIAIRKSANLDIFRQKREYFSRSRSVAVGAVIKWVGTDPKTVILTRELSRR